MDINFFKENFEKLYGILITLDLLPQNLKYELIVIENEYDQFIEKSQQLSEEDFEQKNIYGLRYLVVNAQKQLICVKKGCYEPYDRVEYAVHCIYVPSDLMDALAYLFLKFFVAHLCGQLLPQLIEGSLQFEIDQLQVEKYQALSMQKKLGLNKEILKFLNNYPNLYALFSALYSRDLTQFNSPLVLETVEQMGGYLLKSGRISNRVFT